MCRLFGPDIVAEVNNISLMNVSGGFNFLSFYYESSGPGTVFIQSGLFGAGAPLRSLSPPRQPGVWRGQWNRHVGDL
jgi:hypothetical protein